MQIRDKLYIDGRWTAASGKKTLDVISASTEEVMGRIPEGDYACLLYTSPSPRDRTRSRMPSSA